MASPSRCGDSPLDLSPSSRLLDLRKPEGFVDGLLFGYTPVLLVCVLSRATDSSWNSSSSPGSGSRNGRLSRFRSIAISFGGYCSVLDFLHLLVGMKSLQPSCHRASLACRSVQVVWDRFSTWFGLLTLFYIVCALTSGDGY
ncbi:unnamed protein product [Eruca vesicaria subsp. sativa]|uniref:Uncharacterized protein n=1 Tax=Eruca vesicaria subsp. sativa TaxID=29727 RepID=A0ABC8IYI4_ERUVS|nr:unnamed protein product [Eruca vesicaria subsp. sativa]